MLFLLLACTPPNTSAPDSPAVGGWQCAEPEGEVSLVDPGWDLVDTTDDDPSRNPGSGVLFADVDDDGDDDVVIARRAGSVFLHRNTGSGFEIEDLGFSGPAWNVASLDVDEDGVLDLLVAGQPDPKQRTNVLWAWLGDGQGQFSPAAEPLVPQLARVLSIDATDYDGDGHLDLYVVDDFNDRLLHGLGGRGL